MKTLTISSEAKMCRDCGSLEWIQRAYSTVYGRTIYGPRDESGHYNDDFDRSEDEDDWEDSGEPECHECGDTDLEEIGDLTPEQFRILYNLPAECRIDALGLIREGVEVDPETGEPLEEVSSKPRKGKLIGKALHQR